MQEKQHNFLFEIEHLIPAGPSMSILLDWSPLINRPGVAGVVLQTPLLPIQ